MMNGKSKAQLLLSLLGTEGRAVLEKLSPMSAQLLTVGIDNLPEMSVEEKLEVIRETQSMAMPSKPMMAPPSSLGADDDPFAAPVSLDDESIENGQQSLVSESNEGRPMLSMEAEPNMPAAAMSKKAEPVAQPGVAPTPVPNANYADIGAALAKQRPQVIAFILSRLDETMKESVQRHIPANILAQAQSKSLEMVPMSEKV